jgi:hypothetical protein
MRAPGDAPLMPKQHQEGAVPYNAPETIADISKPAAACRKAPIHASRSPAVRQKRSANVKYLPQMHEPAMLG